MKKLYTFIIGSVISLTPGFSQDLEFHENGVAISGSVLTIDSLATSDHILGNYYIVNTTNTTITVTWSRIRAAHMTPYWDQICDDILCFDATNTTVYYRPATFTIAPNDSSVFLPKVYPEGTAGCAIYTYKVYGNSGNFQDSIQVKYRFGGQDCFLDIPETPVSFSVYPNPVSSQLSVNVSTNGNSVQFNVYNIMGEVVLKETLHDGVNSISVTNLTNGIYFYSVLKNNEVIETKKLIVRH